MVQFELENAGPMASIHDRGTRNLFRPPTKLMVCSQAIWSHLKQVRPEPITLVDLRRDLGYGSEDIYRSARSLVSYGFAEKVEVNWSAIRNGKERTYTRIALRFPSEERVASRKW